MRRIGKIGDKKSLESTPWGKLQHLAEDAIQFALSGTLEDTNSEKATALAEAFCAAIDAERAKGTAVMPFGETRCRS